MLDIMLKISLFLIFGGIALFIITLIAMVIVAIKQKKTIMKKYNVDKKFIKNNPNDERVIAFKEAYSKFGDLTKEITNTKKEIEKLNFSLTDKKKEINTLSTNFIKQGKLIKVDFTKMTLIFHKNKEVRLDSITDIQIKTYENTISTTTSNTIQNGKAKRSATSSIIRGGIGLAIGGPLLGAAGVLTAKKKEASNISTNVNTINSVNEIYSIEIITNDINNPFIGINYQAYNRTICLEDYNLILLSLEKGIDYNNEFKDKTSILENELKEIKEAIENKQELIKIKAEEQKDFLK